MKLVQLVDILEDRSYLMVQKLIASLSLIERKIVFGFELALANAIVEFRLDRDGQ
jgi:hypothetical protein